jgi:hypothetical protein
VHSALRLSDWWRLIATCLGLIAGVIRGLAVWSWRRDTCGRRRESMKPYACSRTARGWRRVIPWLGILALLLTASLAWTAAIGDQVALQATHQAGVPLHQEPRGTDNFQRVPDGTRGTVMDVAKDGRWLRLSLPDALREAVVTAQGLRPHGARRAPHAVHWHAHASAGARRAPQGARGPRAHACGEAASPAGAGGPGRPSDRGGVGARAHHAHDVARV